MSLVLAARAGRGGEGRGSPVSWPRQNRAGSTLDWHPDEVVTDCIDALSPLLEGGEGGAGGCGGGAVALGAGSFPRTEG